MRRGFHSTKLKNDLSKEDILTINTDKKFQVNTDLNYINNLMINTDMNTDTNINTDTVTSANNKFNYISTDINFNKKDSNKSINSTIKDINTKDINIKNNLDIKIEKEPKLNWCICNNKSSIDINKQWFSYNDNNLFNINEFAYTDNNNFFNKNDNLLKDNCCENKYQFKFNKDCSCNKTCCNDKKCDIYKFHIDKNMNTEFNTNIENNTDTNINTNTDTKFDISTNTNTNIDIDTNFDFDTDIDIDVDIDLFPDETEADLFLDANKDYCIENDSIKNDSIKSDSIENDSIKNDEEIIYNNSYISQNNFIRSADTTDLKIGKDIRCAIRHALINIDVLDVDKEFIRQLLKLIENTNHISLETFEQLKTIFNSI